jgi:hypothetical protein
MHAQAAAEADAIAAAAAKLKKKTTSFFGFSKGDSAKAGEEAAAGQHKGFFGGMFGKK